MPHLPRYPAELQPLPDATRPQCRKQDGAADYPGGMALDITQCGQPLVGPRQGYTPRLDVLRQRYSLCCSLRNQAFTSFSQADQIFVHDYRLQPGNELLPIF